MFNILLISLAIIAKVLGSCSNETEECDLNTFPTEFLFGAGTSAYQIEGGYNEDGKSRSFWDWLLNTYNLNNANVAADSYHLYKEDVAALQEIGMNFYRFSIAWTRILPRGVRSEVNQAGIDYYNNLLDELEAANIEPVVTIYHWDIPYSLYLSGGWANPDIVDYFVEYADLVFELFGHRVKFWGTLNEPRSFCQDIPEYLGETLFPEWLSGIYEYKCGHHVLLAHAKTYRLYQRKYKKTQKGKLALVLNYDQIMPLTNSTEDLEAAERGFIFNFGWFAHPLVYGDYPQLMKDVIAENSYAQNFSKSRLPKFTYFEQNLIKGAYDLFFINHYTIELVTKADINSTPSFVNDRQVLNLVATTDLNTTNIGFTIFPEGIRGALKQIKEGYGNKGILITENGYSNTGGLNDQDRIEFIQDILTQIRLAMCEDQVKVIGYSYWSLLDSFEWNSAYSAKFGLVEVDFETLTRTLKESAYYYKNLIQTRQINATSDTDVNVVDVEK